MQKEIYRKLCRIIQAKTGLTFSDDKISDVQKIINKRLEALKFNDYIEYLNYIVLENQKDEFSNLINSLTINETFFFRHPQHYECLKKIIIPFICNKTKDNKLRLWSAACANGCEVYSIAILINEMKDYLKDNGIDSVEIIGTDISTDMIDYAKKGIYSKRCVSAEMSAEYRSKYFTKNENNNYLLSEKIKKMVKFRRLNLKNYIFPEELDVIFFRNVLYYFDEDTQYNLIKKIYHSLKKTGFLFLGGTESCPYYEYFKVNHITDAVYYSKWSTDRRIDKKSSYGRTPSWKWHPPKVWYNELNNEVVFDGVFAENCNIEKIKNDIMFNIGLTDYKTNGKINFNFKRLRWLSNDMLGEIRIIFKFLKSKSINLIILIGNNIDLLKWLQTAKFGQYSDIIICETEFPTVLEEKPKFQTEFKKSKKSFCQINKISKQKIRKSAAPIKEKTTEEKSITKLVKIKKCSQMELQYIKKEIIQSLKSNQQLVIDIRNSECVSSELINIVNKAMKSTDNKDLITIIE